MAQVGLTLAQVMISQFVSLSPVLGAVLTAQSLEPASDSVSPSLSVPLPTTPCPRALSLCVSLFFKKNFFFQHLFIFGTERDRA